MLRLLGVPVMLVGVGILMSRARIARAGMAGNRELFGRFANSKYVKGSDAASRLVVVVIGVAFFLAGSMLLIGKTHLG